MIEHIYCTYGIMVCAKRYSVIQRTRNIYEKQTEKSPIIIYIALPSVRRARVCNGTQL